MRFASAAGRSSTLDYSPANLTLFPPLEALVSLLRTGSTSRTLWHGIARSSYKSESRMHKQKLRVPFLDLPAQYESIKDEIWPAMRSVVENHQFILGPAVEELRTELRDVLRSPAHFLATGSGTDSLHLALLAAGIGPGDEVITQANTYAATLEAIAYTGARIVLVELSPPDHTIDVDAVCAAITDKTKAIDPVQVCSASLARSMRSTIWLRKPGLAVIEDASQAHGAEFLGAASARAAQLRSVSTRKNLGVRRRRRRYVERLSVRRTHARIA